MEKIKVYYGAGLFNEMELTYNKMLAEKIRTNDYLKDKIDMYVPQENEAINDKSGYADSLMIAKGDTDMLKETDILIAIMDGQIMDVGLASEIGVAYAMGKSIIGLYSDTRQGTYGNTKKIEALEEIAESQFSYINLYTVGLVKSRGVIVNTSDKLVEELEKKVKELLGDL